MEGCVKVLYRRVEGWGVVHGKGVKRRGGRWIGGCC